MSQKPAPVVMFCFVKMPLSQLHKKMTKMQPQRQPDRKQNQASWSWWSQRSKTTKSKKKGRQRKRQVKGRWSNSTDKTQINNYKTKQIWETQVECRTGGQLRPTKNEEETQVRSKKGWDNIQSKEVDSEIAHELQNKTGNNQTKPHSACHPQVIKKNTRDQTYQRAFLTHTKK